MGMENGNPVSMMVVYTVKPEGEAAFVDLLKKHWPVLHAAGLATDTPARAWRAVGKEGSINYVETFEWMGPESSGVAHQLPEVMQVWEPMGDVVTNMQFMQVAPLEL